MMSTTQTTTTSSSSVTTMSKDGKTRRITSIKEPTRYMYMAFYARVASLLLLTTVLVIILMTFYPLLATFQRRRWRRFIDQVETLWANQFLWLIPMTHLHMYGQFPDASLRPKVIICNHVTDVDWIYLLMMARVTNFGSVDRSGSVKIILKEEIKKIPIFGWGCRLLEFLFLKREWSVDQKRIDESLTQLTSDEEPLWIFLFPEGSTVNTRTMEKCNAWAAKSVPPRPQRSLTLLPRSRGLDHVCEVLLKNSNYEPEIFDMTMTFEGYSGEVPTWEMGYKRNIDILIPNFYKLLFGTASRNCHMESHKFLYKQLKQEYPEGLEAWLDERWTHKEEQLKYFAQHGALNSEISGKPFRIPITGSIWGSLMAVAFYACMWAGLVYTYIQYSAYGGESFFGSA